MARRKPPVKTARGMALRVLGNRLGITENPAGSNTDRRARGITFMQRRVAPWLVGKAWCGTALAFAYQAAGVKGVSWRQASVALIEDDARAGRAPFKHGWLPGTVNPNVIREKVHRGDAVVLFGYGKHVAMYRGIRRRDDGVWVVLTREGNTSSGDGGSQADGGGLFDRERPLHQVRGFARVDFPDRLGA